MSKVRYDGRVAVITGAGAGIGREYALELAKRGAKIVVNDLGGARDGSGSGTSAADNVVKEIKSAGGAAVANYDNVATMDGGEKIIKTALDAFGKVDILINNAGILRDKTFLKMTEAEWDAVIGVHLKGAFCVTQPAMKIMKENNYGRVIFTSSTSGLFGNFGQTNYGAAKLGVVGIMNTLKLEMAKYNIKVNTIAPTAWSRMTEDVIPEAVGKKMKPKFNVPLVLLLCSEECKDSGKIFVMGGGWYGRTAIVSGEGVCLGDAERDIPVEEVRDNFAKIDSLGKTEPLNSGSDIFRYIGPLLA